MMPRSCPRNSPEREAMCTAGGPSWGVETAKPIWAHMVVPGALDTGHRAKRVGVFPACFQSFCWTFPCCAPISPWESWFWSIASQNLTVKRLPWVSKESLWGPEVSASKKDFGNTWAGLLQERPVRFSDRGTHWSVSSELDAGGVPRSTHGLEHSHT